MKKAIQDNPTRWAITVPLWVLLCISGSSYIIWNQKKKDIPKTKHKTLEVTVTDLDTGYSLSGSRELTKEYSVYDIMGIQNNNPCKSFMPIIGTVDQVVRFAISKIGYPYVWAGKGLSTDQYDCSSFVQAAFSKANIILPRTAYEQSKVGMEVSLNNLKKGDVLFFLTNKKRGLPVTHVAIYMGNGKMIHTNTKSKPLRIENFDTNSRYRRLFVVARRYIR